MEVDRMDEMLARIEALVARVEALVSLQERLMGVAESQGPINWGQSIQAAMGEKVQFFPHAGATKQAGAVLHVRPAADAPKADRRVKRNKDETPKFVEFYTEAYPRRVARDDAWRAWKKAVPNAASLLRARSPRDEVVTEEMAEDLLLNRAEQWAKHWRDGGKDKEFIPYPASWLNAGTWKDAPEVTRG